MINANPPAPNTSVPKPTSAQGEAEARASGRDDDSSSFADVLGAQGASDAEHASEAPAVATRSSETDEPAPQSGVAVPASSGDGPRAPDPASLALAVAPALTAPEVARDPALSPPASGIDLAALVSTTHALPAVAVAGDVAQPAAEVAPPEAGRALEGELQKRLALAGSTTAIALMLGLPAGEAAPASGQEDTGVLDLPTIAGAVSAHATEARAGVRVASAEPTAAPPRPPELRSPVGSTGWTDELGTRITWMVDRGEQVASLRLSPENLGPLEVRIAVREGETSVWFGAANADTRAALEQSLPRLKEMLGACGLALADASVFSQTPQDPQHGFTAAALARAAHESGVEPPAGIVMQVSGRGLIDLYA